ncbi:hypothetical protein SLNWT_5834 [Streptomyces albus]|uniref:Uncharacterized protein n=1 Tax=Streptomyces albus (strain ATCC 21838 / DSM 41398 / FERM P-419 / JCM 4703 / NBRC 107858) TaxID=1081613 RepID=A0A0B5F3P4_STRA4|nr:hypothetical protein SLNWT_5834 [Streptomyces albus]AOU80512.1 hypothetical protein SLNHY_5821 [Streptomyces albus]AYN36221.1 hypothetical protein DUI70_5727 [Streptomyces albus]
MNLDCPDGPDQRRHGRDGRRIGLGHLHARSMARPREQTVEKITTGTADRPRAVGLGTGRSGSPSGRSPAVRRSVE